MKILIIDNYDSFTFNLYQYVGEVLGNGGGRVDVRRNDGIDISAVHALRYDRIIISPGPGHPKDDAYFGVSKDVIVQLGKDIPMLGVCLGMQGMVHHLGGSVVAADMPMHGKTSNIEHDESGIFQDVPNGISVMRYHSLIVDPCTLPECFKVTATVAGNAKEIMGIRHTRYPMEGIQFHPESFGTDAGKRMVYNFIYGS